MCQQQTFAKILMLVSPCLVSLSASNCSGTAEWDFREI
jgi:hypothetical protein